MSSLPVVRDQWRPDQRALDGFLHPPRRPPVSGAVLFGLMTMGFAGVLFGGWSILAPISSAAVASGIVKVDTARKVVQHAEGGTIFELLVREGERVAAGQVLVRLDNLESKALHDVRR